MSVPPATDSKAAQEIFISEVFHNLSQPLTALHCTLDLALQRDRTLKQLRASVQSALDNAERLRQRLLLVRALNDAAAPGDPSETTDLSALLGELREDMSLLFESAGRQLVMHLPRVPLQARADRTRLTRALFVFVEYLFRYLPQGELLSLALHEGKEGQAEIQVEAAGCLPVGPTDGDQRAPYSCEIELVRRTFVAAGGKFGFMRCDGQRSFWRATLPLV